MRLHTGPIVAVSGSPSAMAQDAGFAMFDLGGTLLTGDSTGLWLLRRLRRSPARLLVACAVAPFAFPLLAFPGCRKIAGSMLIWAASLGLDEQALQASFVDFAAHMEDGDAHPWRAGAVESLANHLSRGNPIVVVTAAPADLAEVVVERLHVPVSVIGSRLKKFAGGWVLSDHCRNKRKCSALAAAGYGESWPFAYTDSLDDLPLLERAGVHFW